jgi:hypothetical protein
MPMMVEGLPRHLNMSLKNYDWARTVRDPIK